MSFDSYVYFYILFEYMEQTFTWKKLSGRPQALLYYLFVPHEYGASL